MAKPSNVLIGKTRGSIGNATFTVWKGINVIKEKAVNAYSNPTDEQKANNSKFRVMQLFAKSITLFIKAGFAKLAIKQTEYNAFQQANPYSSVIAGTTGAYYIDAVELKLSKGPEPQITSAAVAQNGADSVIITWVSNNYPSVAPDSQMFFAAFDSTTGVLVASSTVATFQDNSATLDNSGLGTNLQDYTYIGFYVNAHNGNVPDSFIILP